MAPLVCSKTPLIRDAAAAPLPALATVTTWLRQKWYVSLTLLTALMFLCLKDPIKGSLALTLGETIIRLVRKVCLLLLAVVARRGTLLGYLLTEVEVLNMYICVLRPTVRCVVVCLSSFVFRMVTPRPPSRTPAAR